MISIVTAYYNRKQLFIRTLESIKTQHFTSPFEVIAVDDGSDEHERLEDLTIQFPFLNVIRLEKNKKWYSNSCIPFNVGFAAAKGDKIIIQNPECLHYGNILDFTNNNLADKTYLSFGCFSLNEENTLTLEKRIKTPHFITTLINSPNLIHGTDGHNGWYSHSVFRPSPFHFCTAITKTNMNKLGGFDELYALGIAYDDNEFLMRVQRLGLNVKFVDNEIVLHQNHYHPTSTSFQNRTNKNQLMQKNLELYQNITSKKSYRANIFLKYTPMNLKPQIYAIEMVFWRSLISAKKTIKSLIKK